MPNVAFRGEQPLTSYRRVAIASWRHPRDPQTYATVELPVSQVELALKGVDGAPTLTHYIAKVAALTLSHHTALNHVLRLGRLYERKHTHIFITTLVRTSRGKDLSGFLIRDTPDKSLQEIAGECTEKTAALRAGSNEGFGASQELLGRLPAWVLRTVLFIQDLLQCGFNISLERFGIPDDPFGSLMLTNVGALGIENAFVPLSPYTRCPLIISLGKPREIPRVEKGQLVAQRCASICFTFDHRYADGAHGALFLRRFQKLFHDPERVLAGGTGAPHA